MVSLSPLPFEQRTGEAAAGARRPSVRGWFSDARRCTADLDRLRRERLYAEQQQRDETRLVIERRAAARRALMGGES